MAAPDPQDDLGWLSQVFDTVLTPTVPILFGPTPEHVTSAYNDAQAAVQDAERGVVDAAGGALDDAARKARNAAVQIALWSGVGLVGFLLLQRTAAR